MADALNPANTASTLERATVWPWIIDLCWSRDPGIGRRTLVVVQAPMHAPPVPEELVPLGAILTRADSFPATRFDDMTPRTREVYKPQYRAFLMWRKARSADKSPAEMQPWVDYDPCAIDESVERWARPVGRCCGD
jgi:hypothetical protein